MGWAEVGVLPSACGPVASDWSVGTEVKSGTVLVDDSVGGGYGPGRDEPEFEFLGGTDGPWLPPLATDAT